MMPEQRRLRMCAEARGLGFKNLDDERIVWRASFKRGASAIDYEAHIDERGVVVNVWTPYSLATQGESARSTTVRAAMQLALVDFDARIVSAIAHASSVTGATQVRRDYERTLRVIRVERDAMDCENITAEQ
jgi:hypothetical protein